MTGGHRRILVVEDDPETAGQLAEELTMSGYEVDLAATGREALSRGSECDYAVITIDRMLPDIDGITVMRQLRDDGIAAPFLIISALGEVDDRVRGLRAGGDDYLVKPFSFVELLAQELDALRMAIGQCVRRLLLLASPCRTIVAIATGWFRSAPERDSLVVIVARSLS